MFIYQCTPRSIYAVYKSLIYSIVFKYVFLLFFLKSFFVNFHSRSEMRVFILRNITLS